MNSYASELGDSGTDVLTSATNILKKVTDIATDPFGASQSQPTAGNQGSQDGSYSANLPDSMKKTIEEIGTNTGIIPKDQQTPDIPDTTTTTTSPSNGGDSDLDIGGFLKRNIKPRPLPAVVGVGVGGYTYYKTGKVLRSVLFGVGSMFIGNFIQERVEMSSEGGN